MITNEYYRRQNRIMRWRFKFVDLINHLFPRRWCYAQLCVWAVGSIRWADIPRADTCREGVDVRDTGSCYCGKYARRDFVEQYEAKFGPSHTAEWRIVD